MTSLLDLSKIDITSDLEAFIVVSEHLLSQNEKSVFLAGDCAYRGAIEDEYFEDEIIEHGEFTGLSCAVGCLIKEQFYDPSFEQNSIYQAPFVLHSVQLSHPGWEINKVSTVMLGCLQRIHDSTEPEIWPLMLDLFALNFIKYQTPHIDWDISVEQNVDKIMSRVFTSGFHHITNNLHKNIESVIEEHKVDLLNYISRMKNQKESNNG